MKNIFKIGLISRFVMLFLFIFGLNTALSTPALAGDHGEINYLKGSCPGTVTWAGGQSTFAFYEGNDVTLQDATCPGYTLTGYIINDDCAFYYTNQSVTVGTTLKPDNVDDLASNGCNITATAQWKAAAFTVEYCMPFSHTQADFDRCVLNGDCDVCDPITIDSTMCPNRSSSFDNSSYTGGAEKFYVPALDTKVLASDITQCELLYAINESGNSDHRLIQSDWSDNSTGESVPTGYKRVKFYTSSNSYITERDYYMGEYAGTLPTASELGLSAVSGKDFVGWTLKGENCNINFGIIDTNSVIVEALSACSSTVFTATAAYADKVKIQFYANGGTGSAPTYTCNMKSCILPQNTYTKTGYKFTKWLVEDGAINFGSNELFNAGTNIVSEFKSDQSNVGITLTPQWEEACNAITIKGSTRGGSGSYTIYKKTGSSTVYSNPTCTTVLSSVPSELKTSLTKTNAMFAGTTNDCIKAEEASHSSVNLTFNTASSCNVTGATTWDARFYCNGYYRGAGKNITGACTGSYINFIYANDKNASSTKTTQVCQYGGPCSTYNIKDIYGNNVGYTASSYLHNCLTPPYAAGYCDQGNTVEFAVAEETSLQSSIKSYIDDFLSDQPGHEEVYGEDLVVALYPHWIAVTNTLKIYANASDSSPYSTKSCPYGATAATCDPESARPSKKGYTLLGYCRGKNNSCSDMIPVGDNSISTLATGSVTIELTAVWDLNIYKVNLDPNYYASASASASGKVSLPSPTVIFEKYGTGWYSDQNATTAFTKLTKLPKYSTYVFQGFYTAKAGTGTRIIDQAGNLVAANTVYDTAGATTNKAAYAKYAACTCTKGTNVSACTVASTNDSNQCVYNVTCASGYTNASNVGAAGVANNTMNCGTASTYTITFDANGGSGGQSGTKSVTYAAALPTISTTKPTKTGYTFAGWYDHATAGKQYYDENGTAKVSAYDKTSNTTLYAHWTTNTYTIVLFKNDGTITSTTTSVTFGGQIPASVTVPTRTGYNFKGYYTSQSSGVQYYDNTGARVYTNKWAIASGTNLYAHWTPIEYTCGGGDYLPAKATSCADCLSGHYCPGGTYSFNETSDQGIGVCPIGTFDTHTMDSCTPCGRGTTNTNDNRTTCIACPNTNNGVESWQQTSWSADTGMVGLCTITACKTGYTFSGAGENTKCTANTYTVTLNVNGGTGGSPASVTATYDSNMPKLTSVPTRAHYTLAGYYDAQSGGNKYYNADGTSAKVWDKTSNTTLYAHWTPNIYTITLVSFPESSSIVKVNTTDANPNKLYVKYGVDVCSDERCRTSVSKITPPTNDAAAFTGFYTTEAGTGTALITADGSFNATTFKNATTNSTLYAGWTTKITTCPAGKYLPKGSNTCASCLAGYYCEGGKYAYNTTANQGLTGVCASGYSTGGATTSTCSACNTGYAATGTAATNHDAADDCKPITYYINYSCNGGTGSAPAKVTAKYDTGYTAAANSCTKTGYSFTGWKCTGGGTSCDGDIIQVNGSIKNITATNGTSINMTAQWSANSYQVCFNANGGSGMPGCVTVTYDAAMPSVNLDNVKRTGYTFLGIYDSADKKYYNTNGSPAVEAWDKASDTTLIAKWDADPIRCTAMYYLPANSIECKKCEAGYYCPDTDTYTYNATQAQGRKQCSQSNQYSTEGRQYCLTCPDGGVIRDVNANGLQDAASECYKEVDYVAAHGTGKQTCYYSATDSKYNLNCYDKSITTCATGYELENPTDLDCKLITYNVVYYDGSTKLTNFNSSAYQYSIEASITTLPTPQKEGYQFVGWYTNSNLTGTPVTQITSSDTGNKTLYAQWTMVKTSLILDKNASDATAGTEHVTAVFGSPMPTPITLPTRKGYTFAGYYDTFAATGGTQYYTADGKSARNWDQNTGGTGIYARWTPNTYKITLNNQGATTAGTTEFYYVYDTGKYYADQGLTTEITKITTPTKTGYTFLDYVHTPSGGASAILGDGTITGSYFSTKASDTTLYAHWSANTYTVSFNTNGGSGNMNNQSFTYDVAQNLKANEFTRSDYLFAGWNTSADGKGTPYSDGASVVNLTDIKDGNVTLYAQWVQNIYTINVNYSCDGFGTAPAPMTCKSSDASCLLAQSTCKKDGYVFVGWLFDGSEQFAGTNISSYITSSNHAKTFNATAVYAETAFTMTVKPLSDGTAGFILGNGVKGGFAVDWGDGTSTAFNKTSSSVQNVTHVYSDVNREYLVQVASVADSVNDQSIKYGISSLYVSSDLAPTVIKLGGSLGKLFQGSKMSLFTDSFKSATNLIEISPTLFNGFTTVQKNFADSMFASCVSLPTIPLNLFVGITPASGATNIFTQMFAGCTELATITNQNGGKTPFIPMDFVYDILPSFPTSQFAFMLTGTSLLSNCPDGFVTNKTVSKPVCQPNEFTITTTDNTSSFNFALSAAGTYYIDWGDSTQVVTLDAPVSSSAMHTVSHTYKTAGKYKIQFAGQATEYYPDGQWGMNTSAISFVNNTNVAEIDGSLGAIFATLTSGEQTQPRFKETFKGNTSLNGSIPETLLDGIYGQPSRRMFQDMFRGCTNLGGSIPSNMFANISGTPTDYLFSGTFADCKNLSGQIPAFDTFTGTLTAEQNTKAFGATFWNAGVGADENGTPLFLPDNLFDGLNPSGFVAKQMELIFTGTKFATECPNNMYKVTATENPFVADWADKAMCNACPLDSLRTVSSVAGENNGATSCFVTCPENITITNGTTSVVKSVLNYTGTSYPSCTYNAQCDTGYDVQNNGTSNPTCGANTYTVTYQTDTQTVVDVVYGQQFEFNQPVPEKVGYTKVGWLDNNGKLYAINETITYNMAYNISVVPQYTANKYVATYDCDNASENITEEITYDADYTLKTNVCTKQGYAFVGWTVDGNLVANSFKWTYPSDTVFIAKWNPLTYDVTYDCGEGTGAAPSSTNVAYDSDFTTAANTCTNVGYNFVGWKVSDTDNSFGADETFSWKYLENKTFVAQWNAQKITCQSGQYLDKTNCLSCDAGYKCPAEPITYTYDGTIQGRVACSGATEYQNQPGQTMCKIVDDGYYKTSDTTQVQCGNNYYCKNSVRTQCADGGITDTATASAATQCYKTGVACTTVGGFGTNTCNYNLTTKDYTDCTQCIVDGCENGYYLDKGTCVICPVGSYCANSVKTSCPEGNYTTKQPGAVVDTECFTTCSDKEVIYGTAYADNPEVFWPAACTHTYGISVTGNACKIVDNVCVETACNYNYEMINGKCELCVRDNALSFKQGAGNCIVETCLYGYYPFRQSCVGDTRECSVAGAVYAEQKWNPKTNSFGPCEIKECSEGTHIDANTCVPDVQSCELEHGTGEKIYNNQLNKWGDCIATSCMPGYTNDPKLTNETWKQCGQCNNRFGTSGEPVVSGYISECEIATCMYQGEKYILENNECRLICDERNDETGSRYWNGSKCVHNCNPGFLAW